MNTRNTGEQRLARKSAKTQGILKQSSIANQFKPKDVEESQTPNFPNRLALPNSNKQASLKNSRQNSRKHSRKSSKIQFEPTVSLDAANKLLQETQRKLSRHRRSNNSNQDLESVYHEDAALKPLTSISGQRNAPAISMNNSQVPFGAATTIFKSTNFQKANNNVSDYLTCESTEEDYGRSQLERQLHSFTRPEVLQYSHISDKAFYKQQQWPQGSLAQSTSEPANKQIDIETLKDETKAILINYMDPHKALHGRGNRKIPSQQIQEIGIVIPQQEQLIPYMQMRRNMITDPQDLYDMILIAIDKIQYVIKTIQQNQMDFSLEDIVDQAVNLAALEFKLLLKRKSKKQSIKSNMSSIQNMFKESNIKGTDPTFLSDFETIGTNLKDISNDVKSFRTIDQFKTLQLQEAMNKFESEEKKNVAQSRQNVSRGGLPNELLPSGFSSIKQRRGQDYHLLFKYLKAWSLYVAQQKQSRNQQEFTETQIMNSIHRSDEQKMRKAMRALKINRLRSQRETQIAEVIRKRRSKRVRRVLLQYWVNRSKRSRRLKEVKVIVNRFRQRRLALACLTGWNRVVFQIRNEQLNFFEAAMVRARYAPEILLEKMAAPYFLESIQSNDRQNILNFHALAHTKFRVPDKRYEVAEVDQLSGQQTIHPGPIRLRKHNVSIFQRSIEHILQYKQMRVLKALKKYVELQKEFRTNKRKRALAMVFKQLLYNSDMNKLMKNLTKMKDFKLLARTWNLLRQQLIKQRYLSQKQAQIEKKHQVLVERRLFGEWHKMFTYYYRIEHGQSKMEPGDAETFYMNRYFQALKSYYFKKRITRPFKNNAKEFFFKNRANAVFQILKDHKKRMKRERRAAKKVQFTFEQNLKRKYLNQYIRIHYLMTSQREFYFTNLRRKVFASLRKSSEYKYIKQRIIKMANQKYCDSLARKVLASLRRNTSQRLEFKAIVIGYRAGFSKLILARALKGLKRHTERQKTKRMQLTYMERLNKGNMLQSCFTNWSLYAQRRSRIKQAYLQIRYNREQKIKQQNLIKMLIHFNRRKLDDQQYREVSAMHRARIVKTFFQIWLNRYKRLRHGEKVFTEMRELQTRQDLFNLWRLKFLHRRASKTRMQSFSNKQREKLISKSFRKLKVLAREQSHRREMNKLCSFIFLKSLMRKSFKALKYNRYYLITRRYAPIQYKHKIKTAIFEAMKAKWKKNRLATRKRKEKRLKLVLGVFNNLKKRWVYNKRVRQNILSLLMDKDLDLTVRCFNALKDWKFRKRELIKHSMPIFFLEEEYFRVRHTLEIWKFHHAKRMRLKQSAAVIEAKQREKSISIFVNLWKQALFQQMLWKHKAIPFHEQVIQEKQKRRIFHVLCKNKELKQEEKNVFRKAFEFYRCQLLLKSMQVLHQYTQQSREHKQKIEFMTLKRNKRIKQDFIELAKVKVMKRNKYREQVEILQVHQQLKTKNLYFIKWYRQYQKEQQLKPMMPFNTKFYAQIMMKRCLRRLYNNRTMSILNRNMKGTADNYYKENIQKKVWDKLLLHSYKYKTKNAMKNLADLHYKRNIILKWIHVTQQRQEARRNLDNHDIISPVSSRKNQDSLNQLRSSYLNLSDANKSLLSGNKSSLERSGITPEDDDLQTSEQSRIPSQDELEKQADLIYKMQMTKKVFIQIHLYAQRQLSKLDQQVQARTHYNLSLKSKSFDHLKHRAVTKIQNREAVDLFQAISQQKMKKSVLSELRQHMDEERQNDLKSEIADQYYRKH